ncbi:MAG: wax ester/triacylglycerol synthase family O-acyltransferase [Solirubrobacteraceae bacterium]|jgi:WS/DGAT/MGAT family acyltransferase
MSPIDAAWLRMDRPTNLAIITTVLWFARPLDWEVVGELLCERLVHRFPRFSQRAVEPRIPLGMPRWEDDPRFDLRRHVHRHRLPAPGDQAALEAFVATLQSTPLDRDKPLWSAHLVDGFGDGAAIVWRIHHCIVDGISLARVLLSLSDHAPEAGIAADVKRHTPTLPAVTAYAAPVMLAGRTLATAIARETRYAVAHPGGILHGRIARVDTRSLAKIARTGPDTPTVLKGPLSVPQRTTWTTPMSINDVKQIGRPTGATVNDVALAALAGALREYLAARGSLVREIRAYMPFNLRPPDEPIPRELGNLFGLVFLTLPIGVAARSERLACVQRRMTEIKRSGEGRVAFDGLCAMGISPLSGERLSIDFFSAKATMVVSNMAGPDKPIRLAGVTVKGMLIMAPRTGSVGLGLTIFSYNGRMTFGVNADAGLLPHPSELMGGIVAELRALRRLAAPPSRA